MIQGPEGSEVRMKVDDIPSVHYDPQASRIGEQQPAQVQHSGSTTRISKQATLMDQGASAGYLKVIDGREEYCHAMTQTSPL